MTGIGEIKRLGIRKRDVPIGMKSLLFTSLESSAIKKALTNTATSELKTKGIHASISDTIEKLDIKSTYVDLGEERYRGITRSRCLQKVAVINIVYF
jgi:hypothetical protein